MTHWLLVSSHSSGALRRGSIQRGVTMLEVLITILIFSFGLLAIAGLQLSALRYQKGAWARSSAAMMASDIAERMRGNLKGAQDGAYSLSGSYTALLASPPAASGCNPRISICTAAQIAQNDISDWFNQIGQELPAGAGTLNGSVGNGFLVRVMWLDKDAVDDQGNLLSASQCGASPVTKNCCPAGTPAGIRCINTLFIP
ncbi:MAG: type IV pilus modification protein PilV [Burkholderiaceae bacterium]